MIAKAVVKMEEAKACGPSEIIIEVVKAGDDAWCLIHLIMITFSVGANSIVSLLCEL